ncbi:MAG: hypothetical protein AAFV88_12815 [Planctomycetota bacterium]
MFQHFRIATPADPMDLESLNQFLRAHQIASVEKRFVEQGDNSFWSVLVTYTESAGTTNKRPDNEKRVDYKEVLPREQFEFPATRGAEVSRRT